MKNYFLKIQIARIFGNIMVSDSFFAISPEYLAFLFFNVSGDNFSSSALLKVEFPLLYEEKSSFDFSMSITTSGCLLLNSAILSLTQASSEGNNKNSGIWRLQLTLSNWLDRRFFFSFLEKIAVQKGSKCGSFSLQHVSSSQYLIYRLRILLKSNQWSCLLTQVDIYWARKSESQSDESALNLKFFLLVETNGGVQNRMRNRSIPHLPGQKQSDKML